MALKLINGEELVRSYDYAYTISKNTGKTNSNLTITNKRIVISKENDTYLDRKEIPLSEVRAFKGIFRKNSIFKWVIAIILVSILMICALVEKEIVAFVVGLLLNAYLVYRAWRCSKVAYLSLQFSFYPLACGALPFTITGYGAVEMLQRTTFLQRLFKGGFSNKVFVDKDTARQIVSEINTVLLEARK